MVLEPGPRTGLWAYVSVGAHLVADSGERLEFLLLAPHPDDSFVELVTMTAYYHADPDRSFRLGVGHTVPIGRPWIPGSQCCHLLVSLPYPLGPELERAQDSSGPVRILWLLPITDQERAFKKDNGLEALEQRFDSARLEYWVPDRASVV